MQFFLLARANCIVTSKVPFYWYLSRLDDVTSFEIDGKDIVVNVDGKNVALKEVSVISTNNGHLGYTDINAKKNFPFKKDFAIKFDIELYKLKKSGEIDKIIMQMLEKR
ncbi:hypothetical protein M9194_07135 [Vibrio sp. S4M6]|uniref:hypothetical protein n=1 Tax=Vibrio sinus TaxID=2946865 RepID=UPI00202A5A06|nr:hypothetical protein [Vibrio sinus]MCL9781199.1 hypothetical protein [Vibrio sinus]